jgi:hypothetical protein
MSKLMKNYEDQTNDKKIISFFQLFPGVDTHQCFRCVLLKMQIQQQFTSMMIWIQI